MTGKWHGGKGDTKRKGANDQKYRAGWDRIFIKEKSKTENGDTSQS